MTSAHKLGPIVVSDGNVKIGRMLNTSRPQVTCPRSCPFYGEGCYADGRHWWAVESAASSDGAWERLVAGFRRAARRGDRFARDRVVGDLVARDARDRERIDHAYIRAIMAARDSVPGAPTVFGYTHVWRKFKRADVERIAASGYVMNASCETEKDVERAVELGMPAVLANDDIPEGTIIAGKRVITCPEQTRGVHCQDCGLCAKPDRRVIIRFRLHGASVAKARRAVARLQHSML